MRSPPLTEKLGDTESLEVSSISSQHRSQPKLTCNRSLTQRTLEYGDALTFDLIFKAYEPFCYRLNEVIGAEICFNEITNEKQFHRIEFSSAYIFIKASTKALSRESTISPAMSIKSNDSINHSRFINSKTRVS